VHISLAAVDESFVPGVLARVNTGGSPGRSWQAEGAAAPAGAESTGQPGKKRQRLE
jgi:hypothetical protein